MLTRKQAIDFLVKYPEKYGHMIGFKDLKELHREWMNDMFSAVEDETLQAHRNSYKTTCVSINLARTMVLKPSLRTLFMRKTDDDVKEVIKQVSNILKHPKTKYFVKCIYGVDLKLIVDNAMELSTNLTFDVKGTSQLVGTGIGGSLTGQHYDVIYTDDIVTVEDRTSKAEREKVKTIYHELQNIKVIGTGRIFNTGTPWHKDDAFSIMPEPKKYDVYTTGILSKEDIEEKKESMPPSLFAANYELKHIAAEDIIFFNPVTGGSIEKVRNAQVTHIDAAYGGDDKTALTICKKTENKYYIYGRLWDKAVDDCVDEIIAERKRLLGGKVWCEDNGDKGYLAKALREKGEKVFTYHEDTNKYIKIVTNLKPDWKNVVFVEGTDQAYIDQILDYNEYAEHDDAPDSASCCLRILHPQKNAEDRVSAFGY